MGEESTFCDNMTRLVQPASREYSENILVNAVYKGLDNFILARSNASYGFTPDLLLFYGYVTINAKSDR